MKQVFNDNNTTTTTTTACIYTKKEIEEGYIKQSLTLTNMVLAAYNNLATTTACDIYNLGVADVTKFSNITCVELKFLGK